MRPHRRFHAVVMAGLLATLAVVGLSAPARAADGVTASTAVPEYLYNAGDAHLDSRVQATGDTDDVLLALEWTPTVDGTVDGARICLDLDPAEVNARLPLFAYLWSADGQLLASGGAFEGITGSEPCFYDIGFRSVAVTAGEHYVVGFWVRDGQYSYVPWGLRCQLTSVTGDIVGLSSRYAYTSLIGSQAPFPTDTYNRNDYLVSPRFTPSAPDPAPDPSPSPAG
jgi:Domain of unknown function (DUF4082)